MTRQNPLHSPSSAQDPIKPVEVSSLFVQTAMDDKHSRPKRSRIWEEQNRAIGYLIPAALCLKAKDIQEKILALANEKSTTASSVSKAFMQFTLLRVHAQKLTLQGRPNAEQRLLTLHWREVEVGWPKEIKPVKPKKKNPLEKPKPVYLAYRWGHDIDVAIRGLADGAAVARGEVVVFLLAHALEEYQCGRLILESESVEVRNRVVASAGGAE